MKNQSVIGIVKKKFGGYYILSEDGKEYPIYAIRPMEAVSADYNTGQYEKYLEKKVKASGWFTGGGIYSAFLEEVE